MMKTLQILILALLLGTANIYAQDEFAPVNLGPKINTRNTELSPIVSADGKEMYFIREMYRKQADDKVQSLWYSRQDDAGVWGIARYLPKPFNTGLTNSAVENISPDNNTILIKGYFKNGDRSKGYSFVTRGLKGWNEPVGIDIDGYNDMAKGKYVGCVLLPDGKGMILTFSEATGSENADLYISFRQPNGSFSRPVYIKALNTQYDESGPFVASDNRTLYFSSDRTGGLGSNDIYKTTRLDNTWMNWSEPVNLGPTINSERFESYFTLDARGDYAYMVSSKDGGLGMEDIVKIKLKNELKPQTVVFIKGKVLNKITNAPLQANITYEDLQTGKNEGIAISDPATGDYQIVLPYGKNYGFTAYNDAYLQISDNIDLRNISEYKEITRNLYLVPFEKGQVVRLNNIFFEFGKATLKPESFPDLDRLVQLMKGKPTLQIELGGHTDNVGNDDVNIKLSIDRATAVMAYLTGKDIKGGRIKASGYGKSKPVTTNDTEDGRAQNRRVEFTILSY